MQGANARIAIDNDAFDNVRLFKNPPIAQPFQMEDADKKSDNETTTSEMLDPVDTNNENEEEENEVYGVETTTLASLLMKTSSE